MPSPGTRVAIAVIAALSCLAAACGSSGRDLREPTSGATAPPRNAPAAGTLQDGSTTTLADVFALATQEWTLGDSLPARFTCDGEDISPELRISSPPEGTVELAIVMIDLDAEGLIHWVVAGITPDTTIVEQATVPEGAVQALAANDETGWFGPCPPTGETHTYEFSLYALSSPSGVTQSQDADSAVSAIIAASIDRSSLTGTYGR